MGIASPGGRRYGDDDDDAKRIPSSPPPFPSSLPLHLPLLPSTLLSLLPSSPLLLSLYSAVEFTEDDYPERECSDPSISEITVTKKQDSVSSLLFYNLVYPFFLLLSTSPHLSPPLLPLLSLPLPHLLPFSVQRRPTRPWCLT